MQRGNYMRMCLHMKHSCIVDFMHFAEGHDVQMGSTRQCVSVSPLSCPNWNQRVFFLPFSSLGLFCCSIYTHDTSPLVVPGRQLDFLPTSINVTNGSFSVRTIDNSLGHLLCCEVAYGGRGSERREKRNDNLASMSSGWANGKSIFHCVHRSVVHNILFYFPFFSRKLRKSMAETAQINIYLFAVARTRRRRLSFATRSSKCCRNYRNEYELRSAEYLLRQKRPTIANGITLSSQNSM